MLLRHIGCDVVSPNEAEIVAVIAPALDQLDVTAAVEQIAGRPGVGTARLRRDHRPTMPGRLAAHRGRRAGRARRRRRQARAGGAGRDAPQRRLRVRGPDFRQPGHPSRDVDAPTAAAVVDVLLGEAAVMALRAGGIDIRLDAMSVHSASSRRCVARRPLEAAALENVVITGGSGAIGLRYARYCIEHGARRVILLSRNGLMIR